MGQSTTAPKKMDDTGEVSSSDKKVFYANLLYLDILAGQMIEKYGAEETREMFAESIQGLTKMTKELDNLLNTLTEGLTKIFSDATGTIGRVDRSTKNFQGLGKGSLWFLNTFMFGIP